jgi:virulence-associated protein VagC
MALFGPKDCSGANERTIMATSRVFKAGNSQAVRIPQALAYDSSITEVEVERHGDTLVIRPQRLGMSDLVSILRAHAGAAPPRTRPEIDWPDRRASRTTPESTDPS